MMNGPPGCTYLSEAETADVDGGPDPPRWNILAAILAAIALGAYVGRTLL